MSNPNVPEEFIRQLAAHHNALLAFITALVGDYAHANDVLQETHVQLWRKADEFTPGHQLLRLGVQRGAVQGARTAGTAETGSLDL